VLVENDWKSFVMDAANRERVYYLSVLSYGKAHATRINLLPPGEAVRHWQPAEFRADLDRCRLLGLNAYRFSFEWSRVQPVEPPWVGQYHAAREAARVAADEADRIRTRGPQPAESRDAFEARIRAMRDEAARQETVATHMLDTPPRPEDFAADAVARYREMVDDLLRRGMTPIVTLSHMTLPLWVRSPPKPRCLFGSTRAATSSGYTSGCSPAPPGRSARPPTSTNHSEPS
jgi:beta-glucosidase/6-phospho-beta-glucosidase/beta-galactosidase